MGQKWEVWANNASMRVLSIAVKRTVPCYFVDVSYCAVVSPHVSLRQMVIAISGLHHKMFGKLGCVVLPCLRGCLGFRREGLQCAKCPTRHRRARTAAWLGHACAGPTVMVTRSNHLLVAGSCCRCCTDGLQTAMPEDGLLHGGEAKPQ